MVDTPEAWPLPGAYGPQAVESPHAVNVLYTLSRVSVDQTEPAEVNPQPGLQ